MKIPQGFDRVYEEARNNKLFHVDLKYSGEKAYSPEQWNAIYGALADKKFVIGLIYIGWLTARGLYQDDIYFPEEH